MQLKAALATLIILGASTSPPSAGGATQLSCDLRAGSPRVFRIAPGLLQERNPDSGEFGVNLCESFRCSSDKGRLTASIESASVIFTLEFDASRRLAKWRSIGASGLKTTEGVCTVESNIERSGLK